MNFGEVRRAQLTKSTILTSTLVLLGTLRSFKVCSDAKERVGAESNGKLSSKTKAWVPECAVKDLPLSRTAALVP